MPYTSYHTDFMAPTRQRELDHIIQIIQITQIIQIRNRSIFAAWQIYIIKWAYVICVRRVQWLTVHLNSPLHRHWIVMFSEFSQVVGVRVRGSPVDDTVI